MALFCVECGAAQPEDNPPLQPGVRCVKVPTVERLHDD